MHLRRFNEFVWRVGWELRNDIRYLAVGVCVILHAGNWPTRVVGFIATILLLPSIVIFAPRVLARCPSLKRLRGK